MGSKVGRGGGEMNWEIGMDIYICQKVKKYIYIVKVKKYIYIYESEDIYIYIYLYKLINI